MPPPLRPLVVCVLWTGDFDRGHPVKDGKRVLLPLLEAHLGRSCSGVRHTCGNKACVNVHHLKETVVRSPGISEERKAKRFAHLLAMQEYTRAKARERYRRNKT